MSARHPHCAGCGPTPHYWYEQADRFRDLAARREAEAWVWLVWFRAAVELIPAAEPEPQRLAA